ncbi:hypothetical protein GCM10010468_32500 [Actinocorallia longicatena]|uniref:Uncharacterized protein n=1 Tax=Actinocorallia longicatena TaxID=111803 RepID=A0ABP6QA37_9ACTN
MGVLAGSPQLVSDEEQQEKPEGDADLPGAPDEATDHGDSLMTEGRMDEWGPLFTDVDRLPSARLWSWANRDYTLPDCTFAR